MSEPAAVLTERRDGVLLVTLNRPDQRNAVNRAVAEGIAAALRPARRRRPSCASAILTGAGKGFCAGMDLKAFVAGERPHVGDRGFAGIVQRPPQKPLIAAIEGFAVAGGLEVALVLRPDRRRARGAARDPRGQARARRRRRRTAAPAAADPLPPRDGAGAHRRADRRRARRRARARQPPRRARPGARDRVRACRPDRRQRAARADGRQAHPRRGARLVRRGAVDPSGRDRAAAIAPRTPARARSPSPRSARRSGAGSSRSASPASPHAVATSRRAPPWSRCSQR